jgi:hypothetical protein
MPVKVPDRMALSIMALCAFSHGASAATISITKEVFTGNAPLADTPSPVCKAKPFAEDDRQHSLLRDNPLRFLILALGLVAVPLQQTLHTAC